MRDPIYNHWKFCTSTSIFTINNWRCQKWQSKNLLRNFWVDKLARLERKKFRRLDASSPVLFAQQEPCKSHLAASLSYILLDFFMITYIYWKTILVIRMIFFWWNGKALRTNNIVANITDVAINARPWFVWALHSHAPHQAIMRFSMLSTIFFSRWTTADHDARYFGGLTGWGHTYAVCELVPFIWVDENSDAFIQRQLNTQSLTKLLHCFVMLTRRIG